MAASLSRQFLLVGLCHNLGLCHNPSLDTFEYNPHPEFTPMDGCTPAKSIVAQRECDRKTDECSDSSHQSLDELPGTGGALTEARKSEK